MNNKLLSCLIAGALGATLALASPAFGHGGGGQGGGGWHGGGGGHGSGWHGGGSHSAHSSPRFSHISFHGGFPHRHVFHHRFHSFALIGASYYSDAYGDCWRRVWTRHGPHYFNVCGDHGY